jgi:hypothetical protein
VLYATTAAYAVTAGAWSANALYWPARQSS